MEKEAQKKKRVEKKKAVTQVLLLGKETTELQIVEICVVSVWEGEWKKMFLYHCSSFHCCLRRLLLAAPGDRLVGQTVYLV